MIGTQSVNKIKQCCFKITVFLVKQALFILIDTFAQNSFVIKHTVIPFTCITIVLGELSHNLCGTGTFFSELVPFYINLCCV